MAKNIVGVSEETTTGVKRLYEMQVSGGSREGVWQEEA
jgi:S-adenosylhomocysteine hydrolase